MNKLIFRKQRYIFIFLVGSIFLFLVTNFVYQQSKKSKAADEIQLANVRLNLKLAFQGIIRDRALEEKKIIVKLTVLDESVVSKYPYNIDFSYNKSDGTWSGAVDMTAIDIAKKYSFFVKGPMHIQQRICDTNPDVLPDSVDRYSCSTSNITFNSGENNFDFSRVILRAGDLPVQDGIADSLDIAKVRQNLGRKDNDILETGDINLDGIVDTQDYSLVIDGLLIRTDDQIPATVTPTPTQITTPSPTPTGATPTPTNTTPTPTPSSLTPTPTSQPSGDWSAPSVLAKGGKAPMVEADATGKFHFVWYDPDALTIWYASCGNSVNSCNKSQVSLGNVESYYPSLALDSSNNPHIVWEVKTGSEYDVYYSFFDGGAWSNPKKISAESKSEVPSIAIDAANTKHVVYQSKDNTQGSIYYISSTNGSSWSTPYLVGDGLRPKIKSGDSKIHIAWMKSDPTYGVFYRSLQNGNWSSPLTVSSGNKDQAPDTDLDSQNNIHLVWIKDKVSSYVKIQGSNLADLKDNLGGYLEYSYWPRIAMDQQGNAHIVFQGKDAADANWGIYYLKKTGSTWGSVTTVSQKNYDQQTPSITIYQSTGAMIFTNGTEVLVSFLQ